MLPTEHYVLRLRRAEGLGCLAPWWQANVQVALAEDYAWVKFDALDDQLVKQSRALAADRYRLQGPWLVREGQQVAEAKLPELDWQPINSVIQFQLPWIGEAGQLAQLSRVTWRLERGGVEQAPAGAIMAWDEFARWVNTAPQSRLQALRYCVSMEHESPARTREALILGTPLPPLAAQYLIAKDNVLIPAGFHWLPGLDVQYVQRSFGIESHQWLLWQASDRWSVIDDRTFRPLSRGSVRLQNGSPA